MEIFRKSFRSSISYRIVFLILVFSAIVGYPIAKAQKVEKKEHSKSRAMSVAHRLLEEGISENDIIIHFFGENNPACSNETFSGRACNRRVEITIR